MESITQLFNDLCEAHLTGLPWKVHLGRQKISKRKAKQNLKRVAYNTLFINLFQDEARKLQSNISRLPVKNKILMLSFNLRVGGLGAQADRLESLVEELEQAEGLPFTEVNAVLDLLVQLAGTGPPQLVPQKKDYFLNNKYVGRNVKYQGYDYYDVSVFEADIQSLITNEECQFNDTIQKTLQIMEAAPGTGLPAIGLFSQNYPAGDKFERETRVSLFGALVHSRTYDMDIKLDLPPVPDNADLSGLAIKVWYHLFWTQNLCMLSVWRFELGFLNIGVVISCVIEAVLEFKLEQGSFVPFVLQRCMIMKMLVLS